MPRTLSSAMMLALASLLLAACGSAGGDGASAGDAGATVSGTTTVVATADINDDGYPDVLEVPLDADDAMRRWHGRADGGFDPAAAATENAAADAIRADLQRRPNHDILADEGVHQARTSGGTLPYAVLHLQRDDALPPTDVGPPVVESLRPTRAQVGALVGVEGSDLAARGETTRVLFDDLEARVLLALPQFVLVTVPDRAPLGMVDVIVARGEEERSRPAPFTIVERPTPRLDSVQPDPMVPGVLAVLRGADLGTPADDVDVTFGGVAASRVLALGTVLFAEVPTGAVTGPVLVTVDGITSNAVDGTVAEALDAPTLTRVTPASASAGSLVRIEGDDLYVIGQAPRVTFGTKRAQLFGLERGALIAIVPAEADGDITVSVGSRTSDGLAFERIVRGAPSIERIEPSSGAPGDTIDILGTDLHDLTGLGDGARPATITARLPRVQFGSARAWFVFPIVGGLRAVVPFTARAGAADVTVELGDSTSAPAAFTIR